jgi:ankyrin repeat protein
MQDSMQRRAVSPACSDELWQWWDAIFYGDAELCAKMLDAGIGVNEPAASFMPALIECIRERKFDVAEVLIARGANPNCYDNARWTALRYAVISGNLGICRRLIAAGASPTFRPPGRASVKTALEEAARMPSLAAVTFFVEECGIDPAQRTERGATLMQVASAEVKAYLRSLKSERKLGAVLATGGESGPNVRSRADIGVL